MITLHLTIYRRKLVEQAHPGRELQFELCSPAVLRLFVMDRIAVTARRNQLGHIEPKPLEQIERNSLFVGSEREVIDRFGGAFVGEIQTRIDRLGSEHHTGANAQMHVRRLVARIAPLGKTLVLVFALQTDHPISHLIGHSGFQQIGFIARIAGNRVAHVHRRGIKMCITRPVAVRACGIVIAQFAVERKTVPPLEGFRLYARLMGPGSVADVTQAAFFEIVADVGCRERSTVEDQAGGVVRDQPAAFGADALHRIVFFEVLPAG